jgi:hypothetical protein
MRSFPASLVAGADMRFECGLIERQSVHGHVLPIDSRASRARFRDWRMQQPAQLITIDARFIARQKK